MNGDPAEGLLGPIASGGLVDGVAVARYQFRLEPMESAVGAVTSTDPEAVFSLAAYRCDGVPLRATVVPGVEPLLFLPGSDDGVVSGIIEIVLENPAAEGEAGSQYSVRLQHAIGGREDGSVLARGSEFLAALDPMSYQALVDFARCDSVRPERCVPRCPRGCWESASRIMTSLVGFEPTDEEPLVAFVGLSGVDRVLRVSSSVPPHFKSLGRARSLWVAYVEDASSPFQTSVDVEFRRRANAGDFESFDPTGQRLRATVGAGATRVVRVGVRRIRMREPPTDIQVTFTRSGPGYGLRQWQRAYRVGSWRRFSFGAGVFVPGDEPGIEKIDLEVPTLFDGSVPDFQMIVPEFDHRPVFLVGMLRWNRPREELYDMRGRRRVSWMLVPEAIFGLGLPSSGNEAFYTGLNWPVVANAGISIGVAHLHQTRLLPGFSAGDRLPWPPKADVSDVAANEWIQVFTFGITYDLLGLR